MNKGIVKKISRKNPKRAESGVVGMIVFIVTSTASVFKMFNKKNQFLEHRHPGKTIETQFSFIKFCEILSKFHKRYLLSHINSVSKIGERHR